MRRGMTLQRYRLRPSRGPRRRHKQQGACRTLPCPAGIGYPLNIHTLNEARRISRSAHEACPVVQYYIYGHGGHEIAVPALVPECFEEPAVGERLQYLRGYSPADVNPGGCECFQCKVSCLGPVD